MTVPSTAVSLSAIQSEFGGANPISLSEYYKGGGTGYVPPTEPTSPVDGTPIATSGTIRVGEFRGLAKVTTPFTENFSAGLTPYSVEAGAMTPPFSIGTSAYGSTLVVASIGSPNIIVRSVSPTKRVTTIGFKFKVEAMSPDDGSFLYVTDAGGNYIFVFDPAREAFYDSFQRPVGYWQPVVGSSTSAAIGSDHVTPGTWYSVLIFNSGGNAVLRLTNLSTSAQLDTVIGTWSSTLDASNLKFVTDGTSFSFSTPVTYADISIA